MQWRIVLSDQGGCYVYVLLQTFSWRLFITIMIRISDLSRNRYWSLWNVNLETPVLLLVTIYSRRMLMLSWIRSSLTSSNIMIVNCGTSYRTVSKSERTYPPVCVFCIFLTRVWQHNKVKFPNRHLHQRSNSNRGRLLARSLRDAKTILRNSEPSSALNPISLDARNILRN